MIKIIKSYITDNHKPKTFVMGITYKKTNIYFFIKCATFL